MNIEIKIKELHNFLHNNSADFQILIDNNTLKTALSGAQQYGITLQETTPTLILKTKEGYLAAIICGNTRISFKKLKHTLEMKDITMADPQTVYAITNANIGEVSLINRNLPTIIDSSVLNNEYCYGGCGIPQRTLKIKSQDLIRITNAQIFDFTEPRTE